MHIFDYLNLNYSSNQYDEVQDYCRCEKIDEEYFRASVRKKTKGKYSTMKKIILGGLISIIGIMGNLAVIIITANPMIGGRSTTSSRLMSTISGFGMTPLMIFSCVFLIIGLIMMGTELKILIKKTGKA